MKLLLQILWGWSVLANGAVGIQVGTIQTNNQNVKLMKMNFTSPVWLQSASNVGGGKEYISFVCEDGNQKIYQLSADGDVTIRSIYNGESITQTLSSPNDTSVQLQSDANTEVFIYGKITKLHCTPYPGGGLQVTSIDVSHAQSLLLLNCNYSKLTTLDVSRNLLLTSLDVAKNQLTEIDVTANLLLTRLDVSANQLTQLDVTKNLELKVLSCGENQLTEIDVTANLLLESFQISKNQITKLDIKNNTSLNQLGLSYITTLIEIYACAVNNYVSTVISDAITDATSVDGTVTLRQGDEFNQTIIDAAMEKGWDVQYYQ